MINRISKKRAGTRKAMMTYATKAVPNAPFPQFKETSRLRLGDAFQLLPAVNFEKLIHQHHCNLREIHDNIPYTVADPPYRKLTQKNKQELVDMAVLHRDRNLQPGQLCRFQGQLASFVKQICENIYVRNCLI